jgi:Domain of unknown function (DUF4279)
MYRDDYPTCKVTHATLRIYGDQLQPDELSIQLGLTPSKCQKKGQITQARSISPVGGWFLSSQGQVESRDVQRHIVWILDQINDRQAFLKDLQDQGYEMDIFCFWVSAHGHGGPELSHEIMQRLSSMRLKVGFDIYC